MGMRVFPHIISIQPDRSLESALSEKQSHSSSFSTNPVAMAADERGRVQAFSSTEFIDYLVEYKPKQPDCQEGNGRVRRKGHEQRI